MVIFLKICDSSLYWQFMWDPRHSYSHPIALAALISNGYTTIYVCLMVIFIFTKYWLFSTMAVVQYADIASETLQTLQYPQIRCFQWATYHNNVSIQCEGVPILVDVIMTTEAFKCVYDIMDSLISVQLWVYIYSAESVSLYNRTINNIGEHNQ